MRAHFIETSKITNKAPLVHIFDAGGILVDKGDQYNAIIKEAALSGGYGWTPNDIENTNGFKLYDVHNYILTKCPNFTLPEFDGFNKAVSEIRGRGEVFEAFPEFVEAVAIAKSKGAKLAVVSDSPRDRLHGMLDGAGINRSDFFVLSRTDMEERGKKGKPFPDLCLAVVKYFDVRPSQCLLWDDSVRGAESGITAGTNVCWVHKKREGEAHPIPSKNMTDYIAENNNSLDLVQYSGVVPYMKKLHNITMDKKDRVMHTAYVIS